MNRNSITSFAEYSDLISGYKTDRSLSNNYMMREEVERHIAASDMSFSATEHNLFLLVRKPMCMRMYYYLNDFDELYVPDENVVIEILFRGNQCFPTVENDYFRHCGFHDFHANRTPAHRLLPPSHSVPSRNGWPAPSVEKDRIRCVV